MKSIIFIVFITIIIFILHIPPTHAQSCGSTTPARATGLVTTPNLIGQFGTTGACIIDTKVSFAPFKLPTYDDLKSIYYTKSKATTSTITSLTVVADQTVYLVNGDLTITSTPSGSGTAIVFVEGVLTINSNYTYGTPTSGTTFVVRGNVNILQSVTRVDAVIISEGTICTAHDGIICLAGNITTSQLVINGSLINLNPASPIRFRRALSDNTLPAEIINHQPKYLVILKTIFSDTLQKWSEISGNEPIPTPPPPTVPDPPTGVAATPGNAQATVTWSAPFDGRSPIIDYTVTSTPGSITATSTASPTTVTGLTNGTTYTFTVRARNAVDPGPESAASTPVTPVADSDGDGVTDAIDCAPTDQYRYQNIASLINDIDQDGWSLGTIGPQCVGGTTIVSSRTYYRQTATTYPWISTTQVLGTDCYDQNADARPGQASYFYDHRGDFSFDYNCMNGEERQPGSCPITTLPAPAGCYLSDPPSGTAGTIASPGCGSSTPLRTCIGIDGSSCSGEAQYVHCEPCPPGAISWNIVDLDFSVAVACH